MQPILGNLYDFIIRNIITRLLGVLLIVSGPNNSNAQTWKISVRKFENHATEKLAIPNIWCILFKRITADCKITADLRMRRF